MYTKKPYLSIASMGEPKIFGLHNCVNKICLMVVNRYKKPIVIAGMGFIAYFVVVMKYVSVTFQYN